MSDTGYWRYMYTAGQPVHLLVYCVLLRWRARFFNLDSTPFVYMYELGGGGGARNFINGTCSLFYCTLKTPHHTLIRPHTTKLHQILLYSLQHQLPTRSVLHHHDPSDLQYTVELHCPGKERRNKGITDPQKKGEQIESEYVEEK